jgi:hypothetical protein
VRYEAIAHELLVEFQSTKMAAAMLGQDWVPARLTARDIDDNEFTADVPDFSLLIATAMLLRHDLTAPLDFIGLAVEAVGRHAAPGEALDVTGTPEGSGMILAYYNDPTSETFRAITAMVANPDGVVYQVRSTVSKDDRGMPVFGAAVPSKAGQTGGMLAEAVLR